MALSVVLIAVVAVVLVGMYGGLSFSPAGPTDGPAPTADVEAGFERAAPLVGFSVAVPALPDSWHPNSFSFTDPSGSGGVPGEYAVVRGGWIIDDLAFITVVQAKAQPAQVLAAELGGVGRTAGVELVDGVEWTVTQGRRGEAAWYRTTDDLTLLITGSASADDFHTLARAIDQG